MVGQSEHSRVCSVAPAEYGEDYRSHLLDQYRTYVETADKISQRRSTANNYLLTVNAFLVSLYGVVSTLRAPKSTHV